MNGLTGRYQCPSAIFLYCQDMEMAQHKTCRVGSDEEVKNESLFVLSLSQVAQRYDTITFRKRFSSSSDRLKNPLMINIFIIWARSINDGYSPSTFQRFTMSSLLSALSRPNEKQGC